MFKHFNHISEKKSDGSRKWFKVDYLGRPSIWEDYKREQAFRNAIRNVKPIVIEDKKKKKSNDNSL